MNEGLRRHVKYISIVQLRFLGLTLAFGAVYGLFMAIMGSGSMEQMKEQGLNYFTLIMLIVPMSIQMRYVKNITGFVLSMGCTRKSLVMGQHIMSVELLAESVALVGAARLLVSGSGETWGFNNACYYVMEIILLMAAGIFGGTMLDKFGRIGFVLYFVVTGSVLGGAIYAAIAIGSIKIDAWINKGSGILIPVGAVLVSVAVYCIVSFWIAKRIARMEVVC